jgi:hypothetical protein
MSSTASPLLRGGGSGVLGTVLDRCRQPSSAARKGIIGSDSAAKSDRVAKAVRARLWGGASSKAASKWCGSANPLCAGNSYQALLTSLQHRSDTRVFGALLFSLVESCLMGSQVRRPAMPKQTCLDLRGEGLAMLWWRLPERARRAVLEQYARLIARAAQTGSKKQGAKST